MKLSLPVLGIQRRRGVLRRGHCCVAPLAAVALGALVTKAVGQPSAVNHPHEPSGRFLTRWFLCGPFSTTPPADQAPGQPRRRGFDVDFLASTGGETAAAPHPGLVVTHDAGSATWSLHEAAGDAVDLDAAVSTRSEVAAYGYATIECETEQNAVLAVGSNDGVRVWLNGEEVWSNVLGRLLKPDEDQVPVRLKAGLNSVLLKVEEQGGTWGFCCRFLPFEVDRFGPDLRLFRVQPRGGQTPLLTFGGQRAIVGPLLESAEIVAARVSAPEVPVWRTHWTGGDVPIGVDTARFAAYELRIIHRFVGGATRTNTVLFTAGERVEHTLFGSGRTDYSIVLGADASESEQWAARELQHWLKEISGAEFPIATSAATPEGGRDGSSAPRPEILVGVSPRMRALLGPALRVPDADDEGFRYENIGPAVLIRGGRDRGTMYGVMAFLENELGVRWYTPRVTVVPQRDRWRFVNLERAERPGLRVRNDFYFEAFDPTWAARNRMNGAMGWRAQPGGLECYWGVHTFYPLVPPAEFFANHPEYYSLIAGRRTHERAQLCLSNPDVLRLVIERLRKAIVEHPNYRIYDVSQNDWHGACECDPCQAIARREGSESGPVIWFVNQVAEAIERDHPDKYVGTLAYQYTRKPPATLRPRHNVVVRLCSIECCFAHPFTDCPRNASFVADMQAWAAVAPHLYIWDYVVNFSHYTMPYPNFRVLQPNLVFFRDHRAIGVMEQAAYQSRGGEFAELRAYLLARLLWNPDGDAEAVIDDFLHGYYGRSGQHVRRYFDLLHGRLTPDTHIGLGLRPTDPLFADPFLRDAGAIFDEAEIVADNETVRRRVELARLPLLYLKCKRTPVIAREDGTYARLRAILEREEVRLLAEAGASHLEDFFREVETAR